MKGCRSFTDQEADLIMKSFAGNYAARDRAVFAVGRYTGERISAILHLKVGLSAWINALTKDAVLTADDFVFQSRKGQGPLGRVQYHRILKDAVEANELTGKIATHSMRKTFADRVYEALGRDIFRTQKALGHRNINSTVQYLSFKEADIDAAVLAM